jgi:hypothetical protein
MFLCIFVSGRQIANINSMMVYEIDDVMNNLNQFHIERESHSLGSFISLLNSQLNNIQFIISNETEFSGNVQIKFTDTTASPSSFIRVRTSSEIFFLLGIIDLGRCVQNPANVIEISFEKKIFETRFFKADLLSHIKNLSIYVAGNAVANQENGTQLGTFSLSDDQAANAVSGKKICIEKLIFSQDTIEIS